MTPKFFGNISSDYIQVRDKTLARVGNRRPCLTCREEVEPHVTPSGAKVFFSYCERCRKAGHE